MAGRQSEPSIDEILSSIRKVIAEDDAIGNTSAKSNPPKIATGKGSMDKIIGAKTAEAHTTAADDDILELTNQDSEDLDHTEALVNQETAQGLRQGLSTLAALSEPSAPPQIVRSGETSLEGLVADMLRPMMKEWLDQNLPTLVESMVEREIQRITKKG